METIIKREVHGKILFFNKKKNFGFIEPLQGDYRDIFLGIDQINSEELKYMRKDQRVIYDYFEDGEGVHAENVKVIMDEYTLPPDMEDTDDDFDFDVDDTIDE